MIEVYNAEVVKTYLGYEDHGILTLFIHLKYARGYQGFGGYAIDEFDKQENRRKGSHICGDFITNILRVFQVRSWEEIKGYCRVKVDNGLIVAIGNIVEDIWFTPTTDIRWNEKESK